MLKDFIHEIEQNYPEIISITDLFKESEDISTLDLYTNWQKSQPRKARWIAKKDFNLDSKTNPITLTAWKIDEKYFKAKAKGKDSFDVPSLPKLPNILSRSLFTSNHVENLDHFIIIRGYDKFFNINEVPSTNWNNLQDNTEGPYELTIKENGCIIYASHLNEFGFYKNKSLCIDKHDQLIVASKNSMASEEIKDDIIEGIESLKLDNSEEIDLEEQVKNKLPHYKMGELWIRKHLDASGHTENELLAFLKYFRVTFVFELCDDSFEEHVLPYPQDMSGLYLHGINSNSLILNSWPSEIVTKVANYFGFKTIGYTIKNNLQDVKKFGDEVDGFYEGRSVEGFVVRCRTKVDQNVFFFKIKYDYPYLMFREWREITFHYLRSIKQSQQNFNFRKRYPLTEIYFEWLKNKHRSDPNLFEGYLDWKGIIKCRDIFLKDSKVSIYDQKNIDNNNNIYASGKGTKVVILPVATIGSGKSVLSQCLSTLFNFTHIQSDDYKDGNAFCKKLVSELEKTNFLIADRNNHTIELRKRVTLPILNRFPNTIFIAIQWEILDDDPNILSKQFNITYRRILKRGEHHQKLTPLGTPNMENVMWDFINGFEPIKQNEDINDNVFSKIINISLEESIPEFIYTKVIPALQTLPNYNKLIKDASLLELSSIKNIFSNIIYRSLTPKKSVKLNNINNIMYIGIKLGENIISMITNKLADIKDKNLSDSALNFINLWLKSIKSKDATGLKHVTLAFNGSDMNSTFEAYFNSEIAKNWLGSGIEVTFDKLVWKENKIMCLSVKGLKSITTINNNQSFQKIDLVYSLDPSKFDKVKNFEILPITQKYLHATIGLLDPNTQNVDSNNLLECAFKDTANADLLIEKNIKIIEFNEPISTWGRIIPFTKFQKKKIV